MPGAPHEFSLLHDAALVITATDATLPFVSPWLPLHAERVGVGGSGAGALVAVEEDAPVPAPAERAGGGASVLLRFAGVRAIERSADAIVLDATSDARGRIALRDRRARIVVPSTATVGASRTADDPGLAGDVYSMLTLASAFLVGRLGAALVHAGAVVDPEGRAWLLVGDTHAGKTTTCVSLVSAGWSFLADDQVVLRSSDAPGSPAIVAEGWPRHAHLDEGWDESVVTGARATVDIRARWGTRWLRRAPLGGLLFPSVRADAPTSVSPIHAADAFAALVRQSPWLLADRGVARPVMALLQRAAALPARELWLGRDSYARGDVLAARLASRATASH